MEESQIGHNIPPLEDRIFGDQMGGDPVTPGAVLEAVSSHIQRLRKAEIDKLATRAKELAANVPKIPEKLDRSQAGNALELIGALDRHDQEVKELREAVLTDVKSLLDALTALCKPIDAGLTPIDKKLRPLLVDYLTEKLDAHNAERAGDEPLMTSITERGPSGSKATLIDGWENVVTDPEKVPRALCAPDQKLIDAAIARDETVPGVERSRKTTLRVTK